MIKDELYFLFKKNYLALKIMCEKSRSWDNTDVENLERNVKVLDDSWKLIEEKYEN